MTIETIARARDRVVPAWLDTDTAAVGVVIGAGVLLGAAAAFSARDALLVAVGVTAVLALARRPQWALLLFVAAIPLEYQFQLGGHESLTITKVAGALCFASFAVHAVLQRRRLYGDRTHLLLLALLVVALASSAFARSVGDGVSTTTRYASWVLLYAVVTQFPGDRRLLRRLAWALTLSGGVAGAIGSYNFLSGVTVLATLRYGQQNDYAFVLAALLPLAGWLALTTRGRQRLLAAGCAGLIVAGIVLSFSRGAWLAVAVAGAVYLVSARQHARPLIGLAVVGAIVTSLFVSANPQRVSEGVAAKQLVAQQNVDSRLVLFRGALDLTVAHPVLGVGPGNFGDYYFDITGAPPGTPPLLVVHNTYLEVAAETGLPGLALFVAFLVICAGRANIALRRGLGPPGLAAALQASLVAVLVGFLTLSEEFFAPVWLVGALITVLAMEQRCESST